MNRLDGKVVLVSGPRAASPPRRHARWRRQARWSSSATCLPSARESGPIDHADLLFRKAAVLLIASRRDCAEKGFRK
jgi:hypothetical protein